MKKVLLLATVAFLFSGVSFAGTDKDKKKKKCAKGKSCCNKSKSCDKSKEKTAEMKAPQ